MTLHFSDDLTDVSWPDGAVFVVDDALPGELVAALPGPCLCVEAGESLKSLAGIEGLARQVLTLRSTRPLTLVAVGGGSLGDAVGFLASILWRGVALWQVPTTLLAMVDSAHGGKTAVNLAGHKNQLGTFYVADAVVIAHYFLDTLPLDLREEGLVELLKVLWLQMPKKLEAFDDAETYDALLNDEPEEHRRLWTEVIDAAVEAKQRVVADDPRETTGHRRILNLGHTAGHGLESLYGLPHGRAVAWGLAACAHLSCERAELSEDDACRLLTHLDPLLVPLPDLEAPADREHFCAKLRRDKKRRGDRIISILLDGPGRPLQTDEITAEDWWNALRKSTNAWHSRSLRVSAPDQFRSTDIVLPPDKSRHNRAAAIAHLRPGPTEVSTSGARPAADAVHLRRALERLSALSPEDEAHIHASDGGTTGRFLLAICAHRPGPTNLHFAPSLRRRPHQPLIDSLRDGGAKIEQQTSGFVLTGWKTPPRTLSVDPSRSSQFASALALLSASGHRFELHLQSPPASTPYFDLTLSMLGDAGVDVEVSASTIHFSPTAALQQKVRLAIPADTSSTVVWRAIAALRDDLRAPSFPEVDHPDRRFDAIARQLTSDSHNVTVNLQDAPDLVCVLAALASLLPSSLTVTGASHLRHKESNRIDELAAAFDEVGVSVEPRPDGLHVPTGVQRPQAGAPFDPRGDHRLAMAALVLATATEDLIITDAGCIAKSYPDLWRHARCTGYTATLTDP